MIKDVLVRIKTYYFIGNQSIAPHAKLIEFEDKDKLKVTRTKIDTKFQAKNDLRNNNTSISFFL